MKKAHHAHKGSSTAAMNNTVLSPQKARGMTEPLPNSKTAAGGNKMRFKDGGTVKLPKMMSTMKCS